MNNSFKSLIACFVFACAIVPSFADYDYDCGNDGDPPPDCDGVGANPINPYMANLSRQVTDIRTFGAAPIEFTRIYTSRTLTFNAAYWDFGMDEGWQHNWNYEVRQLSSKTFGFFDIKVRYPNGAEYNFKATDSTGQQLAPPVHCGDRLYKWSGSPVGYTMVTPSGMQYDFLRYLSPKFDLKEVRNGLGFQWTVTQDANHKVKRITNNFGRWIEITRGTVGGVEVITQVTTDDARQASYAYTAWTPTAQQTLTSITYPGGEQAAYTWVGADSLTTGRPLLGTADDPMYGGAGAKTKYVYNYDFIFDFGSGSYLVTGVVKEERNKTNDKTIVSLGGAGPYPQILEGNGTEITKKYTNARLTEIRDGEGRVTMRTYDSGGYGFVATIVAPNTGTTSYTHDFAGRPLTITDALGHAESWTYNSAGFELTHTNKLNHTTTITRDTSNRPTRKDYPDGTYEEWTYDTNGLALTHRLRNTGTNTYTYNSLGNPLTLVDAENNAWTYIYDAPGRPATVTDPRSNATSYDYDWRGQLLSITHPDSTVRSFEYDDYGNRTKVIDELNNATEYTFNEYNRVSSVKDPLNRITSYEYGREPGCSTCGFSAVITKVTLPSGRTVEKTYDLSWKLLTSVDAPGTADEATTTLAYNAAGDVASATNPENEVSTFTYDLLHRRLTATDPLNHTMEWTYDAEGNKLTEELADNTVTTFEYDTMNRLTKTTDALNHMTERTYGGNGTMLTLKDARNNTYAFEYDLRDLRTKMIYPGGSYEQWTYDAAGNMATTRTRAGQVMACTYDTRNRDTFCDWSDFTPDISKTYDAVGRVLTLNNANAELTYTYDNAGQLLSEAQKIMALSTIKTVSYTCTLDGLRATVTYPDGKVFDYSYTARNQVADINFNFLTNPLVHYTYDLAGQRTKRTFNNFTETDYAYDADGRVTLVDNKNASGSFDKREYGYNVVNNRTWEKRDNSLGDTYAYDATQQITGVQYDAADPSGTPNNPTRTQAFSYDGAGNRTAFVETGTTAYTANALNQYTAISGLVGDPPSYNSNGNLTLIGTQEYIFDAQSRLVGATDNVNQTSILYDGRNRAVGRLINTAWTYYAYDGWNTIEEYNGQGNQLAAIAHGVRTDEPIFRWSAGYILCYYSQDALGNVTRLTDTSGAVVEKYSYDVFGNPVILDALNQIRASSFFGNRFMFTGREWCQEARVYDYRNRFYSAELGRFLQVDPLRFDAGDANFYRYVGNSPVNFVDPMGLETADEETCCKEAGGKMVPQWEAEGYSSSQECKDAVADSILSQIVAGAVGGAAGVGASFITKNPYGSGAAGGGAGAAAYALTIAALQAQCDQLTCKMP